MINMLRKGIKFSIQRVYFPQNYFESRHYGKRFNSIGKFTSLSFQLRAIYFHTFAVDMSVYRRARCRITFNVVDFLVVHSSVSDVFFVSPIGLPAY